MAKKPNQTRTSGKKRGPKEKRLVIRDDPHQALARLLESSRQSKAKFDAAHAAGMTALKRRDTQALKASVDAERDAIEKQAAVIDAVSFKPKRGPRN